MIIKHLPRLSAFLLTKSLIVGLALLVATNTTVQAHSHAAKSAWPCEASASWLTTPPPTEIPGGGSNFCQFYQFAWHWFIYLMGPSDADPAVRRFEDTAKYPILLGTADSCTNAENAKPRFFVRMTKDTQPNGEHVIPEEIGQAGDGATIYDQNGNVIFYSVQFGRELCDAPKEGDLPVGTLEMKFAWRIITDAEKPNYVWIDADIVPSDGKDIMTTLGLVGFHLAKGTAEHPELMWASYEHVNNAPDCQNAISGSYNFTSSSCVTCLQNPTDSCMTSCAFNKADPETSLTGTPSEICRVFPNGTAPGDNKGDENVAVVTELNTQLVGPDGILTGVKNQTLQVLSNYFNLGGMWVSDPSKPSSDASNLRGSLQLANPVAETTFQGTLGVAGGKVTTSTSGVVQCFDCHVYTPGQTATSGLSHIVDDVHGSKK